MLAVACAPTEPEDPIIPPSGSPSGTPSGSTPGAGGGNNGGGDSSLPTIEGVSFSSNSFAFAYTGNSFEQDLKDEIVNLPSGASVVIEGMPTDNSAGTYNLTVKISLTGYQTLTLNITLVINPITYDFDGIDYDDQTLIYTGSALSIPEIEGNLPSYVNVSYTSSSDMIEEGEYTVTANFTSTNPSITLSQSSMTATVTVKRQFTVSIKLQGGTGVEDEYKVLNGDLLTLPDPTKEDYDFMGWQKDSINFSLSTPITQSFDLYATWQAKRYPLTYMLNANGLEVTNPNPEYYTHESGVFQLSEPTCDGLEFDGWYFDEEYTSICAQINGNDRQNRTLYAKWTPVAYNITYELNGGTNNSENPATFTVFSEISLLNPTAPTDYIFDGWYIDSNFQNRVLYVVGYKTDITLYAKYSPRSYSISYTLNGGTNHPDAIKKYTHLDGIITLKEPTKSGYEFAGWFKESSFKNQVTTIDASERKSYSLYAKWVVPTFVVTKTSETTGKLTAINVAADITSVDIPETYNGLTITEIGDGTNSVLKNSKHVTSITIPNSVSAIKNYAFAYSNNLSNVILPSALKNIMPNVFLNCTALKTIDLPKNLEQISMNAFSGAGLTEIIIPDSVIYLVEKAFYNNKSLKKAVVSKNATYLEGAFAGCTALEDLTVPYVGGKKSSSWNSNPLYLMFYVSTSYNERPDSDKNADYVPKSLKKLTITNCTSLSTDALRYCSSLEQIILPEGLTTLGTCALDGVDNVLSITLPSTLKTVGSSSLSSVGGLVEVYNLSTLTYEDFKYTGLHNNLLKMHTSASAPSIIRTVGDYKFAEVDGEYTLVKYKGTQKDITLPTLDGGKTYKIGNQALSRIDITSVVMPNCITEIKNMAFYYTTSLTSVTFPQTSLTTIGNSAFCKCSLVSVVIPDSVTQMGEGVFGGGLISSTNNTTLKTVVLGNGLTKISQNLFNGCGALESVTFGENIVTIEYAAFRYCNLKELVLNQKVESIASCAFQGNSNLTHVKLSTNLTSISFDSFVECNIKEIWNPSEIILTMGAIGNGYIAEHATVIHTNLTDEREVW